MPSSDVTNSWLASYSKTERDERVIHLYNDYSGYSTCAIELRDYGPAPLIVNIESAAAQNTMYRTALWTGNHLQLTLMSIPAGGDIGAEVHPTFDQFISVEDGQGYVLMGNSREQLTFQGMVCKGYAIFIPAGTWLNVVNGSYAPLKLYSIYAPPAHPHGAVQRTKEEAETHY